jgi:predicted CXXCH cytochrome family protein
MDESNSPRLRGSAALVGGMILLAMVVAGIFVGKLRPRGEPPNPAKETHPLPSPSTPYKNAAPGVAYVGDEACARCHTEIASAYRRHPMGRSMSRGVGEVAPVAEGTVFEADGAVYAIDRRDGRVFHRETRSDGKTTEAEVAYVIGSGRRGASFLVERDGVLKQSPIAWYAQPGKWDLAPGYRGVNLHFDRTIGAGCLFCHAHRFEFAEGRPTTFHGLSIGCERCHGPGALHDGGAKRADGVDLTIVNPADLSPTLRDAVCEQCHLQGSQRVEVTGRSATDFRPGLPFDAFVKTWTNNADPFERRRSVGQFEQMRQSRCFSASDGRLGCISCHDPHRLPEPAERVAYYRDRCLACHADRGCLLPEEARAAKGPADDCISCHMPRTSASDVAHTSQTLHNIGRPARPSP